MLIAIPEALLYGQNLMLLSKHHNSQVRPPRIMSSLPIYENKNQRGRTVWHHKSAQPNLPKNVTIGFVNNINNKLCFLSLIQINNRKINSFGQVKKRKTERNLPLPVLSPLFCIVDQVVEALRLQRRCQGNMVMLPLALHAAACWEWGISGKVNGQRHWKNKPDLYVATCRSAICLHVTPR